MTNEKKKYCMAKKAYIKEHKRLIPELKRAGLNNEAKEQEQDLKKASK